MPYGAVRRAELVSALAAVRSRIAAACADAGRDPAAVTLIAVTKTWPAADIAILAELGVLDIGENKDQEARAKIAELAAPPSSSIQLRWHVVGQVQTNKARSVVSYAHAVHAVDRARVVAALADATARAQRVTRLEVFVQVSLDRDPNRGGVPEPELPALADAVAARGELQLRGIMAVPPLAADARAAFERVAQLSAELRAAHPDADAISAGMSDDFDIAIGFGSTHVRVGTALLGRRAPFFG